MSKLINITEVSKKLDFIDPITNKPLNHILRYWEKEFKEIKPRKINNRRYYSSDQVEMLKMIKFLLKNKGMTISGVKKLISTNVNKLDERKSDSLKAHYYKRTLKTKSKKLLKKIKDLKDYGKKNAS